MKIKVWPEILATEDGLQLFNFLYQEAWYPYVKQDIVYWAFD